MVGRDRFRYSPSQVIDKIEQYLRLGVDYFIVIPSDLRNKMMKFFSERTITAFK